MKNIILILAILISFNANAQWVQYSGGLTNDKVLALAVNGSNLFAGTEGGGAFLSTNNGQSWSAINNGLTNLIVHAIVIKEGNIFAGTEGRVFRSTNSGGNWIATNNGLTSSYVYAFAVIGSYLFAGCNGGVYRSTNNGTNWTDAGLGFMNVNSLAVNGSNLFASVYGSGVFISTNNGGSWSTVNNGLTNLTVLVLAASGSNLIVGSDVGVFRTTNNGGNWIALNNGLSNLFVRSLTASDSNMFAGTHGGGVFFSSNNGENWIPKNEGFGSTPQIKSMLLSGNYIFAGSFQGFWRRLLSEIITETQSISTEIPIQYSLFQNYPNPFNPSTNIKFAIPKSSVVKIAVYDISGKELEVLVNEKLQPGTYQTEWNGSNYSTGIYFYKISASDFTETRKMILIK